MAFRKDPKEKKEKTGFARLKYGVDEEIWEEEEEPAPKPRKEKKKPRPLLRVVVILALAVVVVGAWMARDSLLMGQMGDWFQTRIAGFQVGDGYPTRITGSQVLPSNLRSSDGMAVTLSDTALTVLNTTAKTVISRQHSFSAPRLCMNGGKYLVYNLGGTGYQIETISKTVLTGNAEGNIQCAALAQNGRFALATQGEGNASKLTVYLQNGEVQYTYAFYDSYISAVALSRDGTQGVVSTVSTNNGAMQSVLHLFDFSKETPVSTVTVSNNLILALHWGDNDSITAIGDTAALYGMLYDFSQNPASAFTSVEYDGATLAAYTMQNSTTCVVFYDGEHSSVVCMDGKNSPMRTELEGKAISCSLYGDSAAVLCDSQVTVLDAATGERLAEKEVGRNAHAVALSSSSTGYVLGINEIKFVDFKAVS